MNSKKINFVIVLLLWAICLQAQHSRNSVAFNSGWFFHQGDLAEAASENTNYTHWQAVLLPHTWNDKDVLADNKRGYYRGVGWYKRAFNLSPDSAKRYFLRFEGVNQECEVYVNGQLAGSHIGGYTAFHVDITAFLNRSKKQIIAIKVDNSFNENIPPLTADFTFFEGIYRPIHLVTTDRQVFSMNDHGASGVYIATPQVNAHEATVQITYHLSNYEKKPRKVALSTHIKGRNQSLYTGSRDILLAPEKDTIVQVIAEGISDFELWSPDSPNMYYVESRLSTDGKELDFVTEPLGFRWFRFDADEGFFLNDKPVKLMGANRHQDRIPFGNALTADMHRQDMHLLKDMGGNFFRTAHYPQARDW